MEKTKLSLKEGVQPKRPAGVATKNVDQAGVWSKITFGWVSPALLLGHDATIEQHDVDDMFSRHDKSQHLCEQFEQACHKYMYKKENQKQKY